MINIIRGRLSLSFFFGFEYLDITFLVALQNFIHVFSQISHNWFDLPVMSHTQEKVYRVECLYT